MKTLTLRLLFALLLAVSSQFFTGCNTVSGLGEDIQILGQRMEDKADDVAHGY